MKRSDRDWVCCSVKRVVSERQSITDENEQYQRVKEIVVGCAAELGGEK